MQLQSRLSQPSMQVGAEDINEIKKTIGLVRDAAGKDIDEVISYLFPNSDNEELPDRTDFSDSKAHTETRKRVESVLDHLAMIQAWTMLNLVLQAAVETIGPEADMRLITGKLTELLTQYAMKCDKPTGAYHQLVISKLAEVIETCGVVDAADQRARVILAETVGPSLGLTVDEAYKLWRLGDPIVTQALKLEAAARVQGAMLSKLPPDLAAALGVAPRDDGDGVDRSVLVNPTDVAEGGSAAFPPGIDLGIEQRRVPRYANDNDGDASRIKVG